MKRFLISVSLLLVLCGAGYAATSFNDVHVSTTVYYQIDSKKWSKDNLTGSIKFVKHLTSGENVFSEYCNDELRYDPNSTREFFYNGDLIGYNKNMMKFHRILFEDGVFAEEKLNEKELKEIFPDYEIIRVSQFKDNEIKLKSSPFKKKTYLLMNDTNVMFYNYNFENLDNSQEPFNCIFTPKKAGVYKLAPKEKSVIYPTYKIVLKYVL